MNIIKYTTKQVLDAPYRQFFSNIEVVICVQKVYACQWAAQRILIVRPDQDAIHQEKSAEVNIFS
jgi:hypothetical protein